MGTGITILSFRVKNQTTSNTDYEQSTEAINIKPTPGTAPGTWLSAEVS